MCKCVDVRIRAAAIGICALVVAAGCTASESAASTGPSRSTGKATRHSINCSSFQGLAEKVIYARGCTDETFTGGHGTTGGALGSNVRWASGQTTKMIVSAVSPLSPKFCPKHSGWIFEEAQKQSGPVFGGGGGQYRAEVCVFKTPKGYWVGNVPNTLVHF